jgi:uncharacterized protein
MDPYSVRFRDPVHGFIHLTHNELKLVESRAFRRLRNIKQLALTYLVYPGAMHTRFEHSLGVMELASRAYDAVARNSGELLGRTLKAIGMTEVQAKTLLRVTALLHDVGHLPFSHGGEDILPLGANGNRIKHEQVSIAIIRDNELASLLKQEFYSDIVEHVAILLGDGEPRPELQILRKLISGQFDADRMDYLIRDSLHCGVGYGNFDYLRLLETLRAKESEEGGLELSLERGGIHTLEAMIMARYWMFAQVYYHKTRRIYDIYLSRYLKGWDQNQYTDLLGVLGQDDLSVMSDIIRDAREGGENPRGQYARRIVGRRHHHAIYETDNHADAKDVKITLAVEKKLRSNYPDVDFILDGEAKNTVHKFFVEDDEQYGDEFPILDTISNRFSRLSEQSDIFRKLPRRFHVLRIYADVPKQELIKYRQAATEIAVERQGVI